MDVTGVTSRRCSRTGKASRGREANATLPPYYRCIMPPASPDLARHARALLPDFELQREIGRGGMGVAYLALDVKLDRPVAVKVLPEQLAATPGVRERFLREARTAAKLSHPGIVPIYRADELDGVAFFVMRYVEGPSLGERLIERTVLPPPEVAVLLSQVARALDYAHARGVVHRDVKPENILIEHPPGTAGSPMAARALVTDFGIARLAAASPLTGTGQVLGTVHYMSPEQANGEELDGRSDLYSLGVVAFRALTGRLPFDNESPVAVLVAHASKPPPTVRSVRADVPGALATIVDRCLQKDRAARYQTGAELASALEAAAHDAGNESVADGKAAALATVAPQVVSEQEAQSLWALAAKLQAETGVQLSAQARTAKLPTTAAGRRSLTSGYRLADVRDAATEAGIPERYVDRAAKQLGLAPSSAASGGSHPLALPLADKSPAVNAFIGNAMSIVYEVEVPREVHEDDYETLVSIIRQQLGDPGHVSTLGRTFLWSSSNQKRQLHISIASRNGRSVIRADERMRQVAGGIFGGVMGGGGGGSSGLAMGLGTGALQSVASGFALWGVGILSSYLVARRLFHWSRAKRDRELRALVAQLAEALGSGS